jgi:hypothetical protein
MHTGESAVDGVPTGGSPTGKRDEQRSAGWQLSSHTAVFAVVELTALVLWLMLGRSQWFFRDEWDFVAGRRVGDLGDLFGPHNEHWTTVPILVYRALFGMFGLRAYLPYRLVVLLLHLVAAALLLVVMRRAGVRPWIAIAAASLFALFGAGWQNIIQPFQICFTGALVLGLTHLLLADHDGRIDRRDYLGLLAGLVGLMTSGVAVSMTVVVGLAVLLRRGWRPALFNTAPLAACYVAWLLAIGRENYTTRNPTAGDVLRFVVTGQRAAYSAMGQLPSLGLVFAIVLIVGFAMALRQRARSGQLRQLAAPVALLAGSVVFLAITATGRLALGVDTARVPRYLHLVAAMSLPALAVAADALAARWRSMLTASIALFLVGIPGNVAALADAQDSLKPIYASSRQMFLALPRDPFARQVPRSLRPEPSVASQVTIGWLLDGVAQHQIPAPDETSPRTFASNRFRLSFDLQHITAATSPCRRLTSPVTTVLKKGDVIGLFYQRLAIAPASGLLLVGAPLSFAPDHGGSAIVALRDVGRVRLGPTSFFAPRVCGPRVGAHT